MIKYLASKANPRVKAWHKLHQRRERYAQGLFLVEGIKLVRELLSCEKWSVEAVVIAEEDQGRLLHYIASFDGDVFVVQREIFDHLSTMVQGEGILAVVRIPERKEPPTSVEQLLVLDGVKDPGNLGTILRSAEAFGFCQVGLCGQGVDPYNAKVVRASMGSLFRLQLFEMDSRWFDRVAHRIFVTDLEGSIPLTEADFTSPFALVIGSESHGVSDIWKQWQTQRIRIPMLGQVESLNAGVAAAVVMSWIRLSR